MKLGNAQLQRELAFAKKLAMAAGGILLNYEKKLGKLKITSKQSYGVASTADLKSEALIVKAIRERFPQHLILSEEAAYREGQDQFEKYRLAPFTWVVDPLDGTNNYLNGLNYYSVCISLTHFGLPVLGVVYRPSTGEMYSAFQNGGARANGRSLLCPTNKKPLGHTLLVTGTHYEKGMDLKREFRIYHNIVKNSRAVRRMGSAALDLCYVASGIFDGLWESGLFPWDMAAPGIICSEAGVVITDIRGEKFSPYQKNIVAARRPLHKKFMKVLLQH